MSAAGAPPPAQPEPGAPAPGDAPGTGAPGVLVARLTGDQHALTAAALHALLVRVPGTGGA